MERITITASEGKVFRRIHDQVKMSDKIILGYDYSTGVKRKDLPEYYEEVDKPVEVMSEEDQIRLNELLIEEQNLL